MAKIKIMSETLANKIAAGEIIERPLSVIKELVENSIDAQSTNISINIKQSGVESIVVCDNGLGMNKEDLSICTKRHATSKIYTNDDLLKIASLGFRGEALASMFVVSKMSITTSTDGEEAYVLNKLNDDLFNIEKIGANRGTTVEVNNLFYNTPVRFTSLNNPMYELAVIVKYLSQVAFSNPNVKLVLTNNDKLVFDSPGNGNVVDIFSRVYNNEIASNMLHKLDSTNNFKISMYYSTPLVSKTNKSFMTLSVNGRIIKNYKIENAIIGAYKNYLHTGQMPICFIDITADYSLLDVNIHPHKQQINIFLIEELIDMIVFNIKEGLQGVEFINSTFDKETTILDFDSNISLEKRNTDNFTFEDTNKNKLDTEKKIQASFDFSETDSSCKSKIANIPYIEYIGILHQTYLLFQNEEGLFLIDQHAAEERINYEKILNNFRQEDKNYQQVIIDQTIELSNFQFIDIEKKLITLSRLGIYAEVFGINTIRIVELSQIFSKLTDIATEINKVFDILSDPNKDIIDFYDDIAISMACKKSIKAKEFITRESAVSLVEQLRECDVPFTCPHGRPIIVKYTTYSIEKMFKRVF